MAEGATDFLEWPQKDNHRFLHAVYRVGDLDRTIKFYTEGFGMKLLRKRDIPEEKCSNAFLGFGPEESHFVVELTYRNQSLAVTKKEEDEVFVSNTPHPSHDLYHKYMHLSLGPAGNSPSI